MITDTHVGADGAAAELEAIVARINGIEGIRFVVHTGDITEKGRDSEFAQAKRILNRLQVPYYIIPGNHDSHWIGYGMAGFRKTWPDDKFLFSQADSCFIGLNAWDVGHVAPKDADWFADRISESPPNATIFLFIHQPLSAIDNWFALSNILRGRRVFVISGHVHRNGEIEYNEIPGATIRAAIGRQKTGWGFGQVEDTPGEIDFYEVGKFGQPSLWGILPKERRREIPEVRRLPFENFGAAVLWRYDLQTRLSAPLISWKGSIFAADASGTIMCFGLTGKILWTYEAKQPIVSRPAVLDGFVWAATVGGRILKLESKTGRLLASADVKEDAQSQLVVFPISETQRRGLLVGTRTGRMICLDADSLVTLWSNQPGQGAIQTRPIVVSRKIVYGSWDGRLRCLDAASGRQVWAWTENDNFYYSPAGCLPQSDGRSVFVCAPDGYVSAVGLSSGQTEWRRKYNAWESIGLSSDGKRILIKTRVDEFDIVNAENGLPIQKIGPSHGGGDILPGEPLEWENGVVFGAQNGFIYRIDQSGRISPLLFLGTAGVSSVELMKDNIFAASNLDGGIVVFKIDPKD